jgi:hypothetical protein
MRFLKGKQKIKYFFHEKSLRFLGLQNIVPAISKTPHLDENPPKSTPNFVF